MVEIDGLGQELDGAEFASAASPLVISICSHHHHREGGELLLDLAKQLKPVHDRHVDVRQDDDQGGLDPSSQLLQRCLARSGEVDHVCALARLAAKTLTKQFGDIGFVIDNQDADTHVALAPAVAKSRGRRTVNSVNWPTSLSTSIVPPCSCVTMS